MTSSSLTHQLQSTATGQPVTDWTRRLWIYPAILLVVATPYFFSGVLRGQFVFDDIKLVKDNEKIRELPSIYEIFDITSDRWADEEVRPNYRPMRFLSYAIDYRLSVWYFGEIEPDNPPVLFFHLTNLAIHLINTLLVLALARRIFGNGVAALAVALLFGLHPIQTEAVAYISGRRDVLSTFFFLAGLLIYLGRSRSDDTPRDASWWAVLTVPVLFAAGLLTKEMVVTLPAVMLLIDLVRRPRLGPARVALHLLVWALALGFVGFKVTNPTLVAEPLGGAIGSTLLTAPRYVLHYGTLLLLPWSQSIDYSYDAIPVSTGLFSPWTTLPALAAVATLVVLGFVALWRRQFLAVGLFWFLGTLVPVLQFVPIAERFAERFLYLPGLGVFFLAGSLLANRRRWNPVALNMGTVVVLLVFFGLSWARCTNWTSPYRVWKSAAAARPQCGRAHFGYGNALLAIGGKSVFDAAQAFSRSIEIFEADPEGLEAEPLRKGYLLQARLLRAQALAGLGSVNAEHYARAIEDYRWLLEQKDVEGTAVGESDHYLVIHFQLGQCFLGLGRSAEAIRAFESLLDKTSGSGELDPRHENLVRAAHYHIGLIHGSRGRTRDAAEALARAWALVEKNGTTSERFNLVDEYADALIANKEYLRAEGYLLAVIEEMKDDPDRKDLFYRLAITLDRRGRPKEAIERLEQCLELDSEFGPALMMLASIEENQGNVDRAEELYQRVLQVSPGHVPAERGLQSVQIRRALAEQPTSRKELREQLSLLDGKLDRAQQHIESGELLAAPDLLNAVMEVKPTKENKSRRARALRMLGDIAGKLGKQAEAETYYQSALDADFGEKEALLGLADLALEKRKDRNAAVTFYRQYLDSLEKGESGRPHAYFNLGKILIESRRNDVQFTELLDLFNEAKARGYGREVEGFLGRVHTELGNWQDAFNHLQAYLDYLDSEDASSTLTGKHRQQEKEKSRTLLYSRVLPHLADE